MTFNMETLLDGGMLDDLDPDLVKDLGEFVCQRQTALSPIVRTNKIINELCEKHADWLVLWDITEPNARQSNTTSTRSSSKRPLPSPRKQRRRPSGPSSFVNIQSSGPPAISSRSSSDEIFAMEDIGTTTLESVHHSTPGNSPMSGAVWKDIPVTPRYVCPR